MGPLASGGDVLGWRPNGLTGQAAGESLLVHLARHPKTATPPRPQDGGAVHRRAHQAHRRRGRQRRRGLHRTTTPPSSRWCARCSRRAEFRASAGRKVRRPFEYLAACMRACPAPVRPGQGPEPGVGREQLSSALLGQEPYSWPAPNGYPDANGKWLLGRRDGVALEHGVVRLRGLLVRCPDLRHRPPRGPHPAHHGRRRPSTGWARRCCAPRSTRPAAPPSSPPPGWPRAPPWKSWYNHPRPARLRPPVAREPGQVSTVSVRPAPADAPVAVPLVGGGSPGAASSPWPAAPPARWPRPPTSARRSSSASPPAPAPPPATPSCRCSCAAAPTASAWCRRSATAPTSRCARHRRPRRLALPLDGRFGLHPAATQLKALYDQGRLADRSRPPAHRTRPGRTSRRRTSSRRARPTRRSPPTGGSAGG